MKRKSCFHCYPSLVLYLFFIFLPISEAKAELADTISYKDESTNDIKSASIKAMFIYTFLTYTTWPESATKEKLNFYVIGTSENENRLFVELESKYNLKPSGGKELHFFQIESIQDLPLNADAVYLSKTSGVGVEEILDRIGLYPCLIVGDAMPFGEPMINFVLLNDKIGFNINELKSKEKGFEFDKKLFDLESYDVISSEKEWVEMAELLEEQKLVIKDQKSFIFDQSLLLESEQEIKRIQLTFIICSTGLLLLALTLLVINLRSKKKIQLQKNLLEIKQIETEKQKAEIAQQHELLEETYKEIKDSITYAKRIQSAILPQARIVKEYLNESFILYKPKDIVAGDFYWLESHANKILFAAADCTGHGVPGAMVSVVCNGALNRSVREFNLTEPGNILDTTRDIVMKEFEKSDEDVKDGMDISLCSLDMNEHLLKWSGANNPLWIIRAGANEIEEYKANKQPIGKYANPKPFITHTIKLERGDTIYLFTDGFQDQFGGEKGKKFKAANLKLLLLSLQKLEMEKQKEQIDFVFENWRGKLEQVDDVCIIGVRI